ncbi:hypothetical protein GFC01_09780 [Desulfofundulus thermobenzoicus]|uniref:Uncharacterized protein n=1 Tax=Desulfofundulus thermobenzoicus TaxID=29376 RepID=A0A6N7IR42_9FIRM|nr:hypothetical protein [Desulfofundulus thermobenzoicus]MQL52546.1 hypothetical protein [Desulfofundulus thermobenzoicus]HHW44020.1 hypothetical protein [Desulfotomaculum sp.]
MCMEYCCEEENIDHPLSFPGLRPAVVAAITGALLAGGYLAEGERVVSILPAGRSLWKWEGVRELMDSRTFVRENRMTGR